MSATGLMLLRTTDLRGYRGVDRHPFEPLIPATRMSAMPSSGRISDYESGWRRDVYRSAEDNAVQGYDFLYSRRDLAIRLQAELASHGESYEVVEIEMSRPEEPVSSHAPLDLLGYDVAYPGGDFYSAVKNGLIVNPSSQLISKYASKLNQFGLFDDRATAIGYLRDFRLEVLSEATREFWLYAIRLVAQTPLAPRMS